MEDYERRRAGRAVAARMARLNLSVGDVARRAQVHPATLRALIKGERWPNLQTRTAVGAALGWVDDDIAKIAAAGLPDLHRFTTLDLVDELRIRAEAHGW